jgi:hypothetical protein
MEDERNDAPAWEPMHIEEAGHVGEVMQGSNKVSPTEKVSLDIAET